ncbi:Anaphase-promoting complex subunit 7 [Armadillidium vulgare]|nr:Anaphase-promoting complex subunit 7 [Armadillidium vulgare]
MRYDAAIDLLLKQVAVQSTYKLHQMLADFHTHIQDEEKAAHHFSIALNLSLETNSSRPLEGTTRVEAPAEVLDMEVEEIGDSEGEAEESDLEAVWSDVDFSLSGQ